MKGVGFICINWCDIIYHAYASPKVKSEEAARVSPDGSEQQQQQQQQQEGSDNPAKEPEVIVIE